MLQVVLHESFASSAKVRMPNNLFCENLAFDFCTRCMQTCKALKISRSQDIFPTQTLRKFYFLSSVKRESTINY